MTSPPRELLVIADASPLILLAKVGRLPLLTALAEEIWVPSIVWAEVVQGGGTRPEVAAITTLLAHAVREAEPALQAAYALQVDRGEAAALGLADRHRHALLLIDDGRGRRFPVTAAMGISRDVLARMVFAEFDRLVLWGIAIGAVASAIAVWPNVTTLPPAPTLIFVATLLLGIVVLNLASGWLIFRWSVRDLRPGLTQAAAKRAQLKQCP